MQVLITQGDILEFKADVLALKYAEGLFGVAASAYDILKSNGIDIENELPSKDQFLLVDTNNIISSNKLLFVGVASLGEFQYSEIKIFTKNVLEILSDQKADIEHICLTLHGINYGLKEDQVLNAEIQGFIDAINSGNYPRNLKYISIVDLNETRVKELQRILQTLLPNGTINSYHPSAKLLMQIKAVITSFKIQEFHNINKDAKKDFLKYILNTSQNLVEEITGIITTTDKNYFTDVKGILSNFTDVLKKMEEINTNLKSNRRILTSLIFSHILPLQGEKELCLLRLKSENQTETYYCLSTIWKITALSLQIMSDYDYEALLLDIEKEATNNLYNILNKIGISLITKGIFPWDKVGAIMAPGGEEALMYLYNLYTSQQTTLQA